MSSQTVDRVRRGYDFWNSGTPDLMLDLYAEDAEVDLSDMGVYRGRDSMRRQLDVLWEAWEGIRMDPLAVFDVGGGRLLVDLRCQGREIEQRAAVLYTFRAADDKIVRAQLFPSVEAAMDFATSSDAHGLTHSA
jgi:ketosteroid isomerase-like protein